MLRFHLAFALALLAAGASAQIPAFPSAEGYGGYAKGGRGGDVYIVTNTDAAGPGSFRYGIETVPAAGRTIVFAVSGHIHINGLRLTGSKVTIAGQTAPGDGVGLVDGTFRISGDDVIVRHLRFRHRKSGSGGDCINLDSGSQNSILDSISMAFSTDENISSFGSPPENLTMQWSLNAWGLESHSCGGLWDQNHATAHHTLWAHHHTRNPKSRPSGLLEWINNVTFDWDIGFIMGDSQTPAPWKANVIGNYFLCPPGNLRSKAMQKATVDRNGNPNFSIYLANNRHDNDGDGLLNGTDKGYTIVEGAEFAAGDPPGANRYVKALTPFANTGSIPVTTDDPVVAFKKIVSKAGPLRLDVSYPGGLRDEVDARLIQNLVTQTRNHISNESQLGLTNGGIGTLLSAPAPIDSDKDGMPDYYETALGWNPTLQDHNTALASSGGLLTGPTFFPTGTVAGYTRLEEYLHFKAIPHGTVAKNLAGSPTSLTIDLAKYTAGFSATPVFSTSNALGGTVSVAGSVATFTPTLNYTGRARFDFTVTDAAGHSWTQTCALVVTNTGLPRELLWKGAGAVWDESALHWLRPANGATVAFSAGDRVTFDDSGLAQPSVSLSGSLAPTTVEINATGHYTFSGSGSVASTGTLAKRGPGTLTLTTSHTYTGGGTLEAGTVLFGTGGTLGGGLFNLLRDITLTNNYPAGTTLAIGASFDVPAGNTATLNTGNRLAYGGALSGAGTLQLNVQTTVSRFDLLGPAAGLTGELRFTGSGGTRLFFNGGNFNGFDQAHVRLDGAVSLLPQTNSGGNALNIGTLSGTHASATLGGGSAGPVAYTIGARGGDTTFAGAITGNASLSKVGPGTLTLGGTSNYTGATAVNVGALLVDGALGNTAVTVASGALLGGSGTFGGAVTAQNGAFLSPGTVPFTGASMTVNGGLTLGAATLYYDLSGTPVGANDQIVMGGGVLTFSAAPHFQFLLLDGTLAPGTYTLISGGTNTSAPTSPTLTHNLPTGTRQTFSLQRSGSGSGQGFVRLVVSGNPATLTWTGAASADWDTASANWSGATPNTFFPNDAVIFDDTSTVNAIATPAAVAPRSVLFSNATRAYTLSGAGLTGSAVLTKSGPGALTLTGTNAHTGGTTIQAGATITLGNDTANAGALGSGPITFLGGKLAMYSSTTGFSGSTWHLAVPVGQTGTLEADARHDLYGSLTGGGTLHFYVPWIRTNLYADWSAFTGQINVTTDADGGELRLATNYAFPGFPAAHLDLGPKVVARYEGILAQGAGTTIELGALAGGSQATLLGGPASSGARALTYVVGGRGSDATFAGAIAEQDAAVTRTALVKTGAGTWTLAGPCTHRGATTVAAGTLRFTSGGTLQNDAPITVAAGATLALHGGSLVCDSVNIAAGGTFTCTGGSLTGEVQNAGTLSLTSGTLVVQGDLVNTGTLRVTGLASLQVTGSVINEGLLDLLTAASTLPGNFTNSGIIIENSARRILSAIRTGPSFTCTAHGYAGHAYQLQRADTLAGPWVNVGSAQAGAGAVLTFTDPGGATGPQRFYRLLVTP